ncbi:Breast cancer anti-estrogen resistance protein 3 [Myotis davidii]|uniref:Breast cancer anti-estrogen resistance protein 3 n=1 Tax=Myotis davidii TaxID=225400 RepID=L5M7Z2_MYODS|nr:Breast cancer anti-estrogen resistance protein 3 [Myotis davidii]
MSVNHQFPLASSMDLLSSKSPLADHRTDAYQDVSIHGTLPRKKKGPPPIRSCDSFSHAGTLPHSKSPRQNSPLTQDIIQEHPRQDWKGEVFTSRDQQLLDPTLEYVKVTAERRYALYREFSSYISYATISMAPGPQSHSIQMAHKNLRLYIFLHKPSLSCFRIGMWYIRHLAGRSQSAGQPRGGDSDVCSSVGCSRKSSSKFDLEEKVWPQLSAQQDVNKRPIENVIVFHFIYYQRKALMAPVSSLVYEKKNHI